MYNVKCNNCNTLIQIELRETNLGGTKVGYFICPDCKAVYIGYVNSPAFSTLVNKRRMIIEQMASSKGNRKEYDRLYRKLEKCEKRLNRTENELKKKYKKIIETKVNGGNEHGWKQPE